MSIEDRNLAAGTKLVARYKGKEYTAEVVETEEGLRYRLEDGKEFKSLSSAGSADGRRALLLQRLPGGVRCSQGRRAAGLPQGPQAGGLRSLIRLRQPNSERGGPLRGPSFFVGHCFRPLLLEALVSNG